MKKFLAVLVAATTILALAGCGAKKSTDNGATSDNSATSESEESKADVKSEGVMTYDEYVKADLETKVVVETYAQEVKGMTYTSTFQTEIRHIHSQSEHTFAEKILMYTKQLKNLKSEIL